MDQLDSQDNVQQSLKRKAHHLVDDSNLEVFPSKQLLTDDNEDIFLDNEDDVDEDVESPTDPFVTHFDTILDPKDVKEFSEQPKKVIKEDDWMEMKKFIEINNENPKLNSISLTRKQNLKQFCLKNTLIENISKAVITSDTNQTTNGLNSFQYELFSIVSQYKDLLFTERNGQNAEQIRLIYCIHALNHVLKTRSRILNHNSKIVRHVSTDDEYRDQGLTRTKVLILVPFRDSVLRIVQILISLMFGDIKDKDEKKFNIMNGKRFFEEFTVENEMPKLHKKPEDYEQIFTGNIDDSFRIGLSVTKKSLKLYSDFYSADIIIASPLGLRMIIGSEGDAEREFDFLSSIEMLVMDQTDIFLMQNWEHVLHIMKHLHLTPAENRGIDFSRVRMWALEGWTKYYTQLVIVSSITVPMITSLFNKHSNNYSGKVMTKNEIFSTKAAVSSVIIQCPQVFHRFDCKSMVLASDERFKFFVTTILPKFKDKLMKRTMIYIQSYFDFVRIRNYFRKEEINFTQICEYTADGKVAKSRSMFFNGGRHFLLYTERFHFYRRYKIKGIRHLIFYELPNYPNFYSELINFMHLSMQGKKFVGDYSSMSCTAIYNKFDALQLTAIVGHKKATQMLQSSTSVHMFVTEN
ncbi:U3 small nucleolar RNA-associated protein 25 homolog [Oppia nitens]|uniref:U3 small nucleolar RNA-associated protein 25 homolog n=1 Tax=Oppia nitens TaxID=1686743 RepID=UPI0023DC2226|nr:U3 small nucleolar RNA-associated protein 25 homolog [Oppia nitens]